jgi:diguanylate cyclase (GGDEF)-like protein
MVSDLHLHSMLFITVSMMFASIVLLIKGGYNKLIFEAVKSLSTWVYSITFILIFVFSIELLKYISATEMILVSRMNILISLVFSFLILKRNTLGQGVWALPLIICGLVLVFMQVENSLIYVFILAVGSSISKSAYFFSIELNKTGYKTKNYLDDFGVLGFILAISSIVSIIFMVTGSVISNEIGLTTRLFPNFEDYTNPMLLVLGGAYGLIGFTVLRYLEFKSVQSIKSELFMCLITLVPLITLCLESLAGGLGLINNQVSINPTLLVANILIIAGGLLIVILKVLNEELSDEKDRAELLRTIQNTMVFVHEDTKRASELLSIKEHKIKDVLENKNFKILKSEFKTINSNFYQKIAMSDHLTGLSNRLDFTTSLKHMDKNISSNLFFIDLNKFKPVNDTYGHEAGDFILQGIARRLENIFKESTLTRLGGDEFVLLVSNTNKTDSTQMQQQILDEIQKEFVFKGQRLSISASIGFANYPEDTSKPDELIKIADNSMYKDKNNR